MKTSKQVSSKHKVITLTDDLFSLTCCELQRRLDKHVGKDRPDLVIGILSGGANVASRLYVDVAHADIDCRRKSTRKFKRKLFRVVVSVLPKFVNNFLRIFEARLLNARKGLPSAPEVDSSTAESISRARHILLVDDAIDSGVTMRSVIKAIESLKSDGARLTTAVVTVTTPSPVVKPDVAIYRNGSLIRFPWSADFR